MAGDWIKIELILPDKPEIHRMSAILDLEPDAIVGRLVRVWGWVNQHSTDGRAFGVDGRFIDRYAGCIGFASAMLAVGWLKLCEDGIIIPHFSRHNGQTAKARAQTLQRVSLFRGVRDDSCNAPSVTDALQHARDDDDSCNAPSVTKALPEKRREEKRREEKKKGEGPLQPPGAAKQEKPSIIIDDLEIPRSLDTPQCRAAIEEFLDYRRAIRKPYKKAAHFNRKLSEFLGEPEELVDAVNFSIGNNYQGLFRRSKNEREAIAKNNTAGQVYVEGRQLDGV